MNETQLITQSSFDSELQIDIKSLGEITSNMAKIKNWALTMKESYEKMIFTEETISIAKEEKAKINKVKTQLLAKRKEAIEEFNKPIKEFEQLAKETESILKSTYDSINNQVVLFENQEKDRKIQEVKDYFDEYKASHGLDFVTFEQANVNVTLSASMKSLKEQAKAFIDQILEDIQLINLEKYKEEIMVEYKQTLNASKSIITVKNRIALIEREKQIQEDLKNKEEDFEQKLSNSSKQDEAILQAPKIENIDKKEILIAEEIIDYPFRAVGPKSKVKSVLEYAQSIGIKLIKIKEDK